DYPAPPVRRRHIKNPTTPTSLQKSGEPIGEIEAKDGLPSADRNNKATLLLTGPFRTAKSSAKDLTPLVLKLQYAKYHDALPPPGDTRLLRRQAEASSCPSIRAGGITAFWHGF